MRSVRFFTMFAIFAFAIIAKLAFPAPADAAKVDAAANVASFVMAEEAIALTFILVDVEAPSTAEIPDYVLYAEVAVIELINLGSTFAAGMSPNMPERCHNYDSAETSLNYTGGVHFYGTDNMLRGGVAFVGGGLPYRA